MTVKCTVKALFIDKGISFPEGSIYTGEKTEDRTIVFEAGVVSGQRHEINPSRFSSIEEVRIFQIRDEDEDIRRNLPRCFVTPKTHFDDQGVGFSPSGQIQGHVDLTNELVCFPTGSISSKRHKIPFAQFSENLRMLYSPTPDPNQAGHSSDPNKAE